MIVCPSGEYIGRMYPILSSIARSTPIKNHIKLGFRPINHSFRRSSDHARRLRALPKGEEDDGLDRKELENGVVGSQKVLGGKVEEEESVESQ